VSALTFKALLALDWILRKIQMERELLSVEFPNLEGKICLQIVSLSTDMVQTKLQS